MYVFSHNIVSICQLIVYRYCKLYFSYQSIHFVNQDYPGTLWPFSEGFISSDLKRVLFEKSCIHIWKIGTGKKYND